MDLFDHRMEQDPSHRPLAARMRPEAVEDLVGQEHLLAPGKLLRRAIEADRLGSIILYGPPGCGKTSLAEVIARSTRRYFSRSSGVMSNVSDLRRLMQDAQERKKLHQIETILFIDEIHRFNKSQQDVLLPYVENGDVTLIGATTHNPFFFINTPLTSRSQIFQLQPVSEEAVMALLARAAISPKGLLELNVVLEETAARHLARYCEGDARKALTALEIAARTTAPNDEGQRVITEEIAAESIQRKAVHYDRDEDAHYDTISAFIKSVRGSDPQAAMYWLARMVEAGEDPRFISRRLIILASEDIGNADPRGLQVAVAAMQAVEMIGMPEGRIILAQATAYLATAPKSNASYLAIDAALKDIREGRVLPVPPHLRDGHYAGSERLGIGGYQYAHDGPGHFVPQVYFDSDARYYAPDGQGYEATILKRMESWEEIMREAKRAERSSDEDQS